MERVAIGQQKLGLDVAVLCRPGSTEPGGDHFALQKQELKQHLACIRHDEIEMLYAAECVKWMKAELDAGRAIDIIYTHVRGTVLLSMCRELAEARGYLWCILSTSLKAMQALCKKINKNNNGVTQSDLTQAHFLSFL